ncbi:hypothetical protein BGZ65_008846 [Modicella reniformis]|uniref:Crinkler effector protein N-terminal domain-containing protein n=1 Tax=Modicella reniformis TaxID=1440133 RepID=A0A9P6MAS7_9FUNG|nr:hypothetical protein BGZ65_008846 [Modicella reniformis]
MATFIFCLVAGSPVPNAFPAEATSKTISGAQKKLLKTDKTPDFDDIPADTLKLWPNLSSGTRPVSPPQAVDLVDALTSITSVFFKSDTSHAKFLNEFATGQHSLPSPRAVYPAYHESPDVEKPEALEDAMTTIAPREQFSSKIPRYAICLFLE